jgi:cellulose synthase (UDP-forming)
MLACQGSNGGRWGQEAALAIQAQRRGRARHRLGARRKLTPGPIRWRLGLVAAAVAIVTGVRYLSWRLHTLAGTGSIGRVFFAAEVVNFVGLAVTALALVRVGRYRIPPAYLPAGDVDVYVTVCGEPVDMVESTVRAAMAIDHPHVTYVLNDGRIAKKDGWDQIDAMCDRLDVPCFTRVTGARGKAANLNHALALTGGDFILTLDADHLVDPAVAEEVLPWFDDPDVGFVCTRQRFAVDGPDVLNNEEAMFYGALQRAKDASDAAFSCGNGSVYRRSALTDIGGFSEWSLVEDLHTSYRLHAAGWSSSYVPQEVTVGEAPVLAAEYARQRLRWAIDSLRILLFDNPMLKTGLRARQRLHYLHTSASYLILAAQTVFVMGPILYLFARVEVLRTPSTATYLGHVVPYLVAVGATLVAFVGLVGGFRTAQAAIFDAPVYVTAIVATVLGRRPGGVTRKVGASRFSWLIVPQAVAFVALVVGVAFAAFDHRRGASAIAVAWAGVIAYVLAGPLACMWEDHRRVRVLSFTARALVVVVVAGTLIRGLPAPYRYRLAAPATGAYFGVSTDDLPDGNVSLASWIRSHGGARPELVQWFQQWRSGDRAFQTDWLRAIAAQGAVPFITWEPWVKPVGAYGDPDQGTSRLQRILDGTDDDYIRSWARAAAAYGGPILLRFMHEMNGSWYPWSIGVNGNTPAQSAAAWRHVHDLFVQQGATNVEWVWSIEEVHTAADERDLLEAYPGDAYVDWVGVSGVNNTPGTWRTFDQIFDESYRFLTQFHRPIVISETGTIGDDQQRMAWMTDAFASAARSMPALRAMVWVDRDVEFDYRLGPSSTALLARTVQDRAWRAPLVRVRT